MDKIIFLDIDGVLNCRNTFKERKQERIFYSRFLEKNDFNLAKISMCDIDFEKLQLLKYIVLETNAKIVISSSWKKLRYYLLIEELLINKGIPIIGATPYINNKRGTEIRKYLSENEVNDFIIIDDEIFNDYDDELINHLVKTDFYNEGLNEEKAYEAINLIRKKLWLKK